MQKTQTKDQQQFKIAKQFNKQLKELFKLFSKESKFKSKAHLKYLENSMNTTIKTNPLYAIAMLGSYIWNCSEDIFNENSEVFLNRQYSREVKKLSMKHRFNYQDALKSIEHIKNTYALTMNSEDRQKVHNITREMALLNIDYIKLVGS
jgi:hypothetical protein